ncbi:hypothetical protein [Streptomyces sp. NPDC094468]|uniref:hypothetical protein n=1 Tax=Streptomyces sp. NPDC094468 TaxID=3366066 RepID=UPI0037F873DE
MGQELTTQDEFDAFAEAVAQKLGTHCRTAPLPQYGAGLSRLIIDGEGRALWVCQPDGRQPSKLRIKAVLSDESQTERPSIGVTAISADHVARAITRRLYPLHAEASDVAAQLAAQAKVEADSRRAVAEAVAGALPGAVIHEGDRRTRILWEHPVRPPGQRALGAAHRACVEVGPSGEWVTVDVKAFHPDTVIPMLAAFAQTGPR